MTAAKVQEEFLVRFPYPCRRVPSAAGGTTAQLSARFRLRGDRRRDDDFRYCLGTRTEQDPRRRVCEEELDIDRAWPILSASYF